MNARIGPLCLSSGQMTSEKIVVLKMDAPVAVRQVQHPMELALWFLTVAIDCISLMARVNIFHKIPMNISLKFSRFNDYTSTTLRYFCRLLCHRKC